MKNIPNDSKVFIIVLNYNGGEFTRNCLKSLEKVDYANLEILVVDNGSKDDSVAMVKNNFPKVVVLENKENSGFAGGNNIGIKHALENKADYVLLLNQDTEVEPDFLKKLIEVACKNNEIGLLSPLIFWKRTPQIWFSRGKINWFNMKSYHEKIFRKGKPFESEFLTGCSLLIKKEVLEKIGLLDDKFFLYWEDADFSMRARRAGFKNLVVPDSIIYHFETSQEMNKNKIYWLVLSGLIFFKKNTPWFFRPWLYFFIKLRKTKNWLDRKFKGGELVNSVYKAYEDFKNVKI